MRSTALINANNNVRNEMADSTRPNQPIVTSSSDMVNVTLQANSSVARCPNCANEVEDGGDFCEHCGARIFGFRDPHPEPSTSRRPVDEIPLEAKSDLPAEGWAAYRRLRNTFAFFTILVLLLAIAVFSVNRIRSTERARLAETIQPIKAANTAARDPRSIHDDMVYVPGGTFTMGNDLGDEYEQPAHAVTIKPFLIDIHEVTVEDYQEFLNVTARKAPANWTATPSSANSGRLPVTGVDWYDAAAYAAWAGKRLPTEQEWELAARGFDGRKYPWGNNWNSGLANAGDSSAGHAVDVGAYPGGRSPFGALDMVGNVWEWTASDLEIYPDSHAKLPVGIRKVIRGGSWAIDSPADWTTTFRGFAVPAGGKDYTKIGFRCAMTAEATKK